MDSRSTTIPKIIHQIWIGDQTLAPRKWMNTWKEKHPAFEYISWNEDLIQQMNIKFVCQEQIDKISEINGKADIMRWEILYRFGGVFIDADSICIEPLPLEMFTKHGFASFENESTRKGLIATGTMGFPPKHQLCKDIIDWISTSSEASISIVQNRAWYSVGPACLTKFLNSGKYKDISIFPSYYFLPIHFTGTTYLGHKKVFAHQGWGTAYENYKTFDYSIPKVLLTPPPELWISILISSYNTETTYIRDCLNSIRNQKGWFGFQLVWVNDGSSIEHTMGLENELLLFKSNTRFCNLTYLKNLGNQGIAYSLNYGLLHCHHETVFRMDSDDIMFDTRIEKQLDYLNKHTQVAVCGTGMEMFNTDGARKPIVHSPVMSFTEYKKSPKMWIANHPTIAMKKSIILSIGNYNPSIKGYEDLELYIRLLKQGYELHNLPDILLYYRVHEKQLSNTLDSKSLSSIVQDLILHDEPMNNLL